MDHDVGAASHRPAVLQPEMAPAGKDQAPEGGLDPVKERGFGLRAVDEGQAGKAVVVGRIRGTRSKMFHDCTHYTGAVMFRESGRGRNRGEARPDGGKGRRARPGDRGRRDAGSGSLKRRAGGPGANFGDQMAPDFSKITSGLVFAFAGGFRGGLK